LVEDAERYTRRRGNGETGPEVLDQLATVKMWLWVLEDPMQFAPTLERTWADMDGFVGLMLHCYKGRLRKLQEAERKQAP
jgi:hypothetical protein